jgi:hypothetical protein
MTELQRQLYCHFLESKAAAKLLSGKATGVRGAAHAPYLPINIRCPCGDPVPRPD